MNIYKDIINLLESGSVYLFTVVTGDFIGEKMVLQDGKFYYMNHGMETFWSGAVMLADLSRCPYQYEALGAAVFVEHMVQEPELVICGGGHISMELAVMADYLEYPYTIVDDREEFANFDRFPGARNCISRPFGEVLEQCEFSSNAYYIIVTRGHMADLQCLELVMKHPYGYVGMIGSKNKVKKAMDVMRKKGFDEKKLKDIHAPIGLEIGGETPREIAISIIAQIIQVKNSQQKSSFLDEQIKHGLLQETPMVLVRIIDKKGSAPRGVGSKMLVGKDGILCGTIGGGVIEYKAVQKAQGLVGEDTCMMEHYQLNTDSAAALGMWCGGEVDVFFESLR